MSVRKYGLTFVTVLLSILFFSSLAFARDISNTNSACADVLIVFSRGSSENPDGLLTDLPFSEDFIKKEAVAGSFFMSFKEKIDNEYPLATYKAVSVHNFPNLYNPNGYRAVGIFSAQTFFNAVQAEYSWFPFGEYNKSVGDGKEETVGYIKDQISLCPDQHLVLGGYSQGAQVMGESVFMLSSEERQHVSALALFGDPKYVGSDISSSSSSLNWFDSLTPIFNRPKAKPWRRGTAGLNDRGLADARIPYVPNDMEYKTLSWCFNDDFVCAGGSGIFQTIKSTFLGGSSPTAEDYANGHTRYATFGAQQAASEIIQRLAPSISQLDKSRGGKDPDATSSQGYPIRPNSKPIDIMMMLNTSSGVDDVLGQMRINTIEVLQPLMYFNDNVLYGIGEYSENGDLPNNRIPRVVIHQELTANLTNLNNKMYRQLAYGEQSGGGLDRPDPHQLGIERAVMSTSWRDNAEKHVVIISNRLPSSDYTYNMCNSSVRIGFGITTPNKCNISPQQEADLSKLHPERCAKILDVLTNLNCAVEMEDPFHTYNVVRRPDDAIELARAKGIMIDVVVPGVITQFYDSTTGTTYTVQMITNALKRIADSTGGVFLQYPSFNKANYTDMYWRILNHKSTKLPLSVVANYDTPESADSLEPFRPKTINTNTAILFDATSENRYDKYGWDFDGDGIWDDFTKSPSTDFVFDLPIGETMAVVAGFNDDEEVSRSNLPINIIAGDDMVGLTAPQLPDEIMAIRTGENIVISWQSQGSSAVVFIGDPESGLPIMSAPLSSGSIVLPDKNNSYSSLVIWVEDESSSSARQSIEVQSPEPVVTEESVKVLNESEADPNSQFLGEQDSTQSILQSSNSNTSGIANQPVLQQTADITAVKGSESVVLQPQSNITRNDIKSDLEKTEHESGNTLQYVAIGLALFVLVGAILYRAMKSKH